MPKKKHNTLPFPVNKETRKKLMANQMVRIVFKNGVAYEDTRYS